MKTFRCIRCGKEIDYYEYYINRGLCDDCRDQDELEEGSTWLWQEVGVHLWG